MITGHESHQIGLDAYIWLTPMPNRLLTRKEREDLMATSVLKDPFTIDMKLLTPLHLACYPASTPLSAFGHARQPLYAI
jgi:penicillin-insensitive murein DD-endopeptidase